MHDIRLKSADLSYTPDETQPLIKTVLLNIPGSNGRIFCLLRILGKTNDDRRRLAEVIIGHLKRLQNTLPEQVNVPRRFEQILSAINEDIYKTYSQGGKIPMTDFHCVVGIFQKNQIFLSGVGHLQALFMHRSAKQRYVLYELDKQFRAEDGDSWEKPFVAVLDGELTKGDIFYLATRVSSNEISTSDLQDTLVTLPPSGALKRIEQHLKTDTAYGAICLKVEDEISKGPPKKTNPLTSIEQLGKTKEETANLLGEQTPDLGSLISRITAPIIKQLSAPGTKGTKSTAKLILRSIIKLLTIVIEMIIKVMIIISKLIMKISGKIFSTLGDKTRRKTLASTVKQKATHFKTRLNELPKTTKYAGLGILLIAIILISSLAYSSKQRLRKEKSAVIDAIVLNIEEKRNAAEASLIYDDDAQARGLLEEALALLETVPASTKGYETIIADLRGSISVVYTSLRGIVEVEVNRLASLGDHDQSARFTAIVDVDGVIYGVTGGLELYRFQELEGQLLKENSASGAISEIRLASSSGNGFYFIDTNQRLGRANVTVNTLNPIVSGVEKLQSVEDMTIYNDNLYVLTASTEQIVKMRPQGDGFDAGTSWITSNNTSLAEAKAIAVDGDIYVLTQTGIVKFTSGKEQVLELDAVEPPLANPNDLWTELGNNFLYVLDPAENRVIVYQKNGNFVLQYTAPEFGNAKNIFVREDKKLIVVATDTEIMSFTASHLLQ